MQSRRVGGSHRLSTTRRRAVSAVAGLTALGCAAAGAAYVTSDSSVRFAAALGTAPGLAAAEAAEGDRPTAGPGATGSPAPRAAVGESRSARPTGDVKQPTPAPTTVSGLPVPALRAYRHAAAELAQTQPSCGLPWYLLAGIGLAESDHGRVGASVIGSDGRSVPRILGPVLDGGRFAAIADSDGGRLDGDETWDRAVGPMQFIPQTWAVVAADGDGDGVRDPDDIDDAALAAASYLCRAGTNLADEAALATAVRSYNNSREYVILVLAYADAYRLGNYPTVPAELLGKLHDGPGRPVTPKRPDKGNARHDGTADGPRPDRGRHGRRPSHPGGGAPDAPDPAPKPDPPPKPPKPPKPDPDPDPSPPPKPPKPKPPKPVIKVVVLTGQLTWCDDAWCVANTYAGDLAAWPVRRDYDGNCEQETMSQELRGLRDSGTTVEVTVQQTVLDHDVVDTVTKAVRPVDPPVCSAPATGATPAP